MPRIWLSLGSNIERERNLRGAIVDLHQQFGELILSTVYESDAVGFDGDPFYNLVVGLDSERSPTELSRIFREIEAAHGRQRGVAKFSPRTLDIDILTYGDNVIHESGVDLPRDEIAKYSFVLRPLAELAPDQRHPETGETFAGMWQNFDQTKQPLTPVAFNWR